MNCDIICAGMAGGLLALASGPALGAQRTKERQLPDKPNIIVILCDDLGYSDIGCYGSEIPTPNIDSLAEEGIRYRCFYNTARSAPSRACLITGLYPHQAGVGSLTRIPGYENYQAYLKPGTNTIPEAIKSAGYFCFMTGKWHLNQKYTQQIDRGFDRALASGGGWYYSDDPNADKKGLFLNDRRCLAEDLSDHGEVWYNTERFVDFGLSFMDEAVSEGKPFFWYLPFCAPHFPLQAPREAIERNRHKYMDGYTAVRERRWEKQKRLGLFSEGDELTPENPHKDFLHWEKMTDGQRDIADYRMAIYAACIEEIDRNVGRVMDHLEKLGIKDNTLVFFLSDNGGNAESAFPGKWIGPDYGASGSVVWLGAPWAGVSNTPFFLYKRHAHQGGCCTPLIISWPAAIDSSLRGSIDKENYGHLVDLMPTLVEVTGGTYPKYHDGSPVPPMEGVSLVPSLRGEKIKRPHPIIVEHEGNKMIRKGDWKLVREYEDCTEIENPWRLYNLRLDPTEMHDVSSSHPWRTRSMIRMYKRWADHIGVEESLKFKVGAWYTPVRDYPESESFSR